MSYPTKSSLFIMVLLLFACSKTPEVIIIEDDPADWIENAKEAYNSLIQLYWDENRGIFYSTNFQNSSLNYWWQAHALDAIVDASIRVNDHQYEGMISAFYDGIKKENCGFTNEYYDDMSWMGLAMIRSYSFTDNALYLSTAKLLWDNIITGWNENQGGGIAWNKQMLYYKNTPSNATAAMLSFRLYSLTGESKYLVMGENIMEWLHSTLVDAHSGLVWDGIGRNGGEHIDKDWLFTYNQGIYMGACIMYYEIVSDTLWIDQAIKTADNALFDFIGKFNILIDEGSGDGGLFKGIFIRYLKMLTEQEFLEDEKKTEYSDFIKNNAERLWDFGRSSFFPYVFNHDWTEAPSRSIDLSVQLSGVFLIEAMAAL